MARKAPWEIAYDAKPDDYWFVQGHEPPSRRYVFVWEYGRRVQKPGAGWRRYYEVYDPRRCRTCGGARVWAGDGSRARCPACDTARQQRSRERRNALVHLGSLIGMTRAPHESWQAFALRVRAEMDRVMTPLAGAEDWGLVS